MFNLLELLNDQETKLQWSDVVGIMMISKDISYVNTDYIKLLRNHGDVKLDGIRKLEDTYIGTESKAAQDTNILYH